LTVLEGSKSIRNDVAVMNEEFFAPVIGSDEPITFFVAEPLHGATSQDFPPPGFCGALSYMLGTGGTI
jgi:hypothetical protein